MAGGETLTRTLLVEALRALGVERGDNLMVHSSLRALGPVEGGADAVIDALLEAVGSKGNLMMPAFNYSRPLPAPFFDPLTTPSRTGALTEVFRRRAIRSLHPTHSVAVVGPDAERLTRDHLRTRAMGIGSPIDLIAGMGGKVLLIGVSHTANSTVHIGEEHAGVAKVSWYDPLPRVNVKLPDGSLHSHELDSSSSCSASFDAVEHPLRARRAIADGRLGGALCRLMRASEVIACVKELIAGQPDILLCRNPRCVPCAGSRRIIGARQREV